jgi:hypothetical protein
MKRSLLLTLQVAGHLAYMVLIPIVLLGGSGLWLDRQLGTLPQYLLIGIAAAFVVTIYWLNVQLRRIISELFKEQK